MIHIILIVIKQFKILSFFFLLLWSSWLLWLYGWLSFLQWMGQRFFSSPVEKAALVNISHFYLQAFNTFQPSPNHHCDDQRAAPVARSRNRWAVQAATPVANRWPSERRGHRKTTVRSDFFHWKNYSNRYSNRTIVMIHSSSLKK